jgi:hypothetical protein
MNTEIQYKIQRDNETAIARILMAKNYLKLKNDVAFFTATLVNQFAKSNSPTSRQILGAIIERDKFIELMNQSK